MNGSAVVEALDADGFAGAIDRLSEILHGCVLEGASVGFILPFSLEEARVYWLTKVAPAQRNGSRIVLVARLGPAIAGTAQLDRDAMPSKRHHAEVSKVLVHPAFRRNGLGRALMLDIERRAMSEERWLLTLDTAGEAAEALYRSMGYSIAGEIPAYARDYRAPDKYDATRLLYKDLRSA